MNKKSIFNEIQMDAINQNVSVSTLLRKTKIVATQLDLSVFLIWINRELDGYKNTKSEDLPDYRKIYGEPKAFNPYHGWQPIIFTSEAQREVFCFAPIGESIGSLENTSKRHENKNTGYLEFNYPPKMKQAIVNSLEYPTDVKLFLSFSSLHNILDSVRNTILEWALALEKSGVDGNGLTIPLDDKKTAQQVTQTIYAQNIHHIGNMADGASITHYEIHLNETNIKKLQDLLTQIDKAIDLLPETEKYLIADETLRIKSHLDRPNLQECTNDVSKSIKTIQNICEQITGNVIASGILELIKSL